MPQMPTIAGAAARRLMPQARLQVEGGSPAAFGAGIGEAVEQLGNAGSDAAAAVARFEFAKLAEADQAAEFERQAKFVEFGSTESTRLDEAARNIEGPALDFTKGFMTDFDARSKEFLQAVPERRRAQWQAKFAAMRGQLAAGALKTEFGQRDTWSKTTLSTSLSAIQNGVAQSPHMLDAYRKQGEDLIDASLLGPQDKADQKIAWRSAAAVAAATGDVEIDPEGALRRLGGREIISVPDLVDGKPTGTSSTKIPAGAVRVPNVNHLLNGLIQQESGGRVGVAGPPTKYGTAHGLTQVLDSTGQEIARKLGIPWRPDLLRGKTDEAAEYQKRMGRFYLEEGLKKYGGDARKALMYYHGGPDTKKWGPKTRAYATAVLARLPRGAAVVVEHAAQTSERLRRDVAGNPAPEPTPGKTYSVGDAVEELGYTTAEAEEFVKTGKKPEGGGPAEPYYAEQGDADPAAANDDLPTVDPRYADLPFAARMQLINGAQREIERREGVAAAVAEESRAEKMNQLLLDLNDGKAGRADIEAAREAGWLTDYADVEKAEDIVDSREKGDSDLVNFNNMINTPGFSFNQFAPDQRAAVEAGVKAMGGSPRAAFEIWEKTGILPKTGAVALRGLMASNNPTNVANGASIASNMLEKNPNAFAGVEGGDEIEKTAMLYRHYVADLGMSKDEAIQKIAKRNDPAVRAKINANADAEKDFRKQINKHSVQIDNWLSNELGGAFVSDPDFSAPEQRAAVRQDFAELAWEHYQDHQDVGAARAYAAGQVKKLYGAVNGRLMKYPPTRSYPPIGGSWDYVFKQAAQDIKGLTGRDVDPKSVYLMPLPTATAEAFRAGRPAPYAVHYTEKVDGQTIYRVLHGKAFVADVGAARSEASRGNEGAFRQSRGTVETFRRASRAAPRPTRGRDY